MRVSTHFLLKLATLVIIGASVPISSWAQNYPSQPVQLVVAYPQGGTGEIVAQPLAEKLAAALGQPVKVEYRPGASGAVGAQSVARAAPDGYTVLVGQTGEIVINKHLVRNLGYNPDKDFQPIAFLAEIPLALVVRSATPYSSPNDLVAAARSSQRGLTFSSGGPGTTGQFAGELLRLRTGARLIHVPTDGAAAALKEVIDSRADFYFAPLPVALPHVKSGELKILAISAMKRSFVAADIPTMLERGFRYFNISAWVGLFAPRGTPADIVQRLNREVNLALAKPDIRERLLNEGADIMLTSSDQFADFVRSEAENYSSLIQEEFCSRFGYGGCWGYTVQ
jgi:tripartite-type tricarboxylate transporter receptor subunit TctC